MSKRKFVQNVSIIVLAVAIIVMSVGYAAYGENLTVTGTTTIQKASWDIHFANYKKTANTNILDSNISAPNLGTGTTSATFTATLAMNQTYEFTMDVENAGTFDALLKSFSLTATKDGVSQTVNADGQSYSNDYLNYSVKWSDGTALAANQALTHNTSKTILINVTTTQPEDDNLLPSDNETYVFTLTLNYSQSN